MIQPPGIAGAAFGTAAVGDLRIDEAARIDVSASLGVTSEWAFVNQVHGAEVVVAEAPGTAGDADAIVTVTPGLPIAVATADCVPVVISAKDAVAVVHAGWRGAAAGVVPAALSWLTSNGHAPKHAAIGPAIGPCCYEVGSEVADQFPGHIAKTSWGSVSVDVPGFLEAQLSGIEVWRAPKCTYTSPEFNSWRRDRTTQRQVAVAWLPIG